VNRKYNFGERASDAGVILNHHVKIGCEIENAEMCLLYGPVLLYETGNEP